MKLDYDLKTLHKRLPYVEALDLSSATAYELETVSNYILQVVPKERQKYKIVTQKEYDDYYRRRKAKVDVSKEEELRILESQSNNYCNISWKIGALDLKETSEMGDILRQYQKTKEHIIEIKEKGKIGIKPYRNLLANINDDMLLVKQIFKGATERAITPKWLGDKMDYSLIDYTNKEHVKVILKILNIDMDVEPNNTLSLIVEDMRVAIKILHRENKIDDKDIAIVTGLNCGYTLKELEQVVEMQYSGINKRFNKVCRKISEYFENKQ